MGNHAPLRRRLRHLCLTLGTLGRKLLHALGAVGHNFRPVADSEGILALECLIIS